MLILFFFINLAVVVDLSPPKPHGTSLLYYITSVLSTIINAVHCPSSVFLLKMVQNSLHEPEQNIFHVDGKEAFLKSEPITIVRL